MLSQVSARITRLRATRNIKSTFSNREIVNDNVDTSTRVSPYFATEMSTDSEQGPSRQCHSDTKGQKKATKRHITPSYEEQESKYTNIMAPTLKKIFKFDNNIVKPPHSTWKPDHWKEQLDNIYEMRKKRDAPVDVMGCEHLGDKEAKPEV